ncbi:hypothetical protein AX14_007491 [Amanita brunnescens Koide BX004]|nr:hypothetical protein AX14_007491 [Amanita brunnescens Koide BX004]
MHKKPLVKREVKMEKGNKAIKHAPIAEAALTQPKFTPVSAIRALLPSLSFRAVATQRTPNDVKTRHGANEMARHVVETRTKALMETTTPRCDKTRSANSIERFDGCSIVDVGPAIKLALISSSEIGEKPRTAVSVQNEVEKNGYAPNSSAAVTLSTSAPISLSGPPTCATTPRQSLIGPKPPVKVISRRGRNILAQRQSCPLFANLISERGGQLARAAVYIQERLARRSPAFDKFTHRAPKMPPDKTTELNVQQHMPSVVREAERMRTSSHSPESLTESASLICLPFETVTTQSNGEARTASSCSAQPVEAMEAHRCPIEHLTETKRVSKELVRSAQTETERLACESFVSETGTMSARPHSNIVPVAGPSPKKSDRSSQSSSVPSLGVLRAKAQEQPLKAVSNMAFLFAEGHLSARHSAHVVDISTRRILCIDKRSPLPKAALTLPKSMPISSLRALPACPDKNTPPSLRELPTLCIPNGVKTRKEGDRTTHRVIENRTGVSQEAASQWFGKLPFANGIERSEERSDAITGPAVEQALALFSTEVEERRWVPSDTIVITQNGAKEIVYTPSQLTASTQPVSMPAAPSVTSKLVVALRQWPDELAPSIEMVSRQQEPSVISYTSMASGSHLPILETARKQSKSLGNPFEVAEGKWLARAATYIRGRANACLSVGDELRFDVVD